MNRRAAIAALMTLPATARVSVAQIHPRDVIVLESDEPLSTRQREAITRTMQTIWPAHRCVVLPAGMRLRIVTEATA